MYVLNRWQDLTSHLQRASTCGHRRLLILPMELARGTVYARAVENVLGDCIWVNAGEGFPPTSIKSSQASQHLGTSVMGLIYNAHDDFNANAFCALTGCVQGGGLVVLLVPELDRWISHQDQQMLAYNHSYTFLDGDEKTDIPVYSWFKHWLVEQWHTTDQTIQPILMYQGQDSAELKIDECPPQKTTAITPNSQQSVIINTLAKAYHEQLSQVYFLNARRGRGKSAALGWLIAQLGSANFQQGPIIVTAPSKRAIASLQEAAGEHSVRFLAVDALLQNTPQASLLIVDEAAAIPLSQLAKIASHYPLLVLSSTQDGYEGSGQGYRLKLPRLCEQLNLDTQYLSLNSPIRWQINDPVEQLLEQSFLCGSIDDLGDSTNQIKSLPLDLHLKQRQVSARELAQNSGLLQQVYGLLMISHYQTTPQDLRLLLDHATARIHLWCHEDLVVGVAWVSLEGGLTHELAAQIELGQRRIQGHLLPQILAQQAGFGVAAEMNCWRIQRIAVLPSWQNSGVGSMMLEEVKTLAVIAGVDYVGASFSAAEELANFWFNNHFECVWLGAKADAATGLNSMQVMLGLSPSSLSLQKQLQAHLKGYLTFGKDYWFKPLSVSVLQRLVLQLKAVPKLADGQKQRLLQLLANGQSGFYGTLYLLQQSELTQAFDEEVSLAATQASKATQTRIRGLAKQVIGQLPDRAE